MNEGRETKSFRNTAGLRGSGVIPARLTVHPFGTRLPIRILRSTGHTGGQRFGKGLATAPGMLY
jgi:hypothetical protein